MQRQWENLDLAVWEVMADFWAFYMGQPKLRSRREAVICANIWGSALENLTADGR
jgi:hypothetical protein